jgi:hypothetical protein
MDGFVEASGLGPAEGAHLRNARPGYGALASPTGSAREFQREDVFDQG